MSGSPLLVVLSDSIRDLMQEVHLAVSKYPDIVSITVPDHSRILEHLKVMDVDGAKKAMLLHRDNARRIQELVLSKEQGKEPSEGILSQE